MAPSPSTPGAAPRHPPAKAARVFDICQVGTVLRALWLVETALGTGALFVATSPQDWLERWALWTGATLPATLAWLLLACRLQAPLQGLGRVGQYAAGLGLGMLAGLGACALLHALGAAGTTPPWLACAAGGGLVANVLVVNWMLRARARQPAATAARLAELQSRIRPHFLFNTLNSAIALVRAEPEQAETLLEDLSDLFRHALREPGEAVTLNDEIALARRYLAIEAVRFGERLQVDWALDPAAGRALLPPLLLQPLVENAVKHGVEPCAQGGRLRIETRRQGSRVSVRLHNSLPPQGTAAGRNAGLGMALGNVRERLALLHDLACEFHAGACADGYEVRLVVPATSP